MDEQTQAIIGDLRRQLTIAQRLAEYMDRDLQAKDAQIRALQLRLEEHAGEKDAEDGS